MVSESGATFVIGRNESVASGPKPERFATVNSVAILSMRLRGRYATKNAIREPTAHENANITV